MKKTVLLALLGLVFLLNLHAQRQNWTEYITNEGDTVSISFRPEFSGVTAKPIFQKLQFKLKYRDPSRKRIIIYPNEIKEITFWIDGVRSRMVSLPIPGGFNFDLDAFASRPKSSHILLEVVCRGKLKLLKYYRNVTDWGGGLNGFGNNSGTGRYRVEKYIIQKGDEDLAYVSKEKLLEYFEDCPELVQKIKDGEFEKKKLNYRKEDNKINFFNFKIFNEYQDVEAIFKYYNSNCGI